MTEQEKVLYSKLKSKFKQRFKRIINKEFAKIHTQLSIRSQKEQQIIGDFLAVFEMSIKEEIKKL